MCAQDVLSAINAVPDGGWLLATAKVLVTARGAGDSC
jgi:hypothetical protein